MGLGDEPACVGEAANECVGFEIHTASFAVKSVSLSMVKNSLKSV